MTDEILTHFKKQITQWTLIPSGGGCFEVEADGEIIFSKRETGRFPEFEEIRHSLAAKV